MRGLFPPEWNPFWAGFGNRDTDEISYKAVGGDKRLDLLLRWLNVPHTCPSSTQVGVPTGRTFIINPRDELRKAEVSVQSSALSSLRAINELVGNIFPPLPPHVSVNCPSAYDSVSHRAS